MNLFFILLRLKIEKKSIIAHDIGLLTTYAFLVEQLYYNINIAVINATVIMTNRIISVFVDNFCLIW